MIDKQDELYQKYISFTGVMLEDYRPMEVAGVMIAQALSMYKTLLTEEEYNKMVDFIYDRKNEIKTFQGPNIQ